MRRAVPGLLAVATLAVAGCGGGSGDRQDALTAYRECLSEHGVELPDGGQQPQGQGGAPPQGTVPQGSAPPQGALPGGQDAQAFQEAMEACADLRPEGQGGGGYGPPGGGTPPTTTTMTPAGTQS